jgi:hypothetical protein
LTIEEPNFFEMALKLHELIGQIKFADMVQGSTGHKVIPVDVDDDPYIRLLIGSLRNAMERYKLNALQSNKVYAGNRMNDVGMSIKNDIAFTLQNTLKYFDAKRIAGVGYPDIEITSRSTLTPPHPTTYLEIKASTMDKDSAFRYLYYSSLGRVQRDAYHLLLDLEMSRKGESNHWVVKDAHVIDLSKVPWTLNTRFEATKRDVYKKEAVLF